MKNFILTLCVFISGIHLVQAQSNTKDKSGISAIKEDDLKKDLFAMADDHFKGRESGTLNELKVSMWLADQARAVGLQPAGEDGTFFQFFPLLRTRTSTKSIFTIGSKSFSVQKEALVMQPLQASIQSSLIYLSSTKKEDLDKLDLKDKVVALQVSREGIDQSMSLPGRRYFRFTYLKYAPDLIARGVAAVIFVADETAEANWKQMAPVFQRGTYAVEGYPPAGGVMGKQIPAIWIHSTDLGLVQKEKSVSLQLQVEEFDYPSVNIIGKIEGTDPVLKKEYVLFSAHQDHDGIRASGQTDSIFNGADDNASASVAIFSIARAFKKSPGKRSALFIWHGAEERSMMGSKWYVNHPVIPLSDIAAVLNGDMIGQNNIDSAALLGSKSPHKNSDALVSMALDANKEGSQFKLDDKWDEVNHLEGFYFRSDHMPYARAGVPAVFYTTLLHPDYHTPRDEANRINYRKLLKMTQWMYLTGWKVANAKDRPAVNKDFKLER